MKGVLIQVEGINERNPAFLLTSGDIFNIESKQASNLKLTVIDIIEFPGRGFVTKTEDIAKICHEANRAYCQTIGDNSQPSWEEAPDWQKNSAIQGVEFHAEHPEAGPSGSHENWLRVKEAEGWKYGPVKDVEKKEHPCFVPYDQLPDQQRRKDYIFCAIVHSFRQNKSVHPSS